MREGGCGGESWGRAGGGKGEEGGGAGEGLRITRERGKDGEKGKRPKSGL